MGVLFWSPNTFWNSSPRELVLALQGYKKANSVSPDDNANTFSEDEKNTLREMREKWG